MAFCPECGKAATAEASSCVHCGHALQPTEKQAGPARFKGTMMMTAPVVAKPNPPANANTAPAIPDAPTVVATPNAVNAAVNAGAFAPNAVAYAPPAKLNAKATMIGAGIAPVVVKPANVVASAVAKPAPAARAPAEGVAFAQTQALIGGPPAEVPRMQQVAAPDPDAFAARAPTEDAHQYLPGDPMAPQALARDHAQPSAARAPGLHLREYDEAPTVDDSISPLMKDRKLLLLAVGAVVLLSVLILAFGLLH